MIWLRLAGATAAFIFGLCTAFRPKIPLYYKIIFFGMASCFLGSCYEALAQLLRPSAAEGFHVGYFGYIGLFFFLYSSYYGAINSLADGGGRDYRRYRLAAGLAALAVCAAGLCGAWLRSEQHLLLSIFTLPVTMAAYFAAKLLIMPDVELGITAAMRPFNALALGLCAVQLLEFCWSFGGAAGWLIAALDGLLLAASLPVARKGVRRWFM
ncbi:MAG TPA: permease [Candidatus Scatomorpha pullistercoris]|uniref:Permease n=1 Tax=Candidatus Scatomorpha pullistercoris TaxID=2840929 RepID=A0A9D1K7P7_9FIRM|nr:permease [Candidatus Scatomorpha pullistercoris]